MSGGDGGHHRHRVRCHRIACLHIQPDVDLHDPDGEFIGYDALEAFSNFLQQRFPGARFEMVGHPDSVGNALRANWRFGPDTGTDFLLLHHDKVRSLYAFVQPASLDSD